MTQTITIEPPGIGYYENEAGEVLGKFDLEPGDHELDDAVATIVYVDDRAALQDITVDAGSSRPDWRQRWQAASTPDEKLQVIEDRFF